MSTPDENRFEEAFTELAHAAELMVDPVDSAVIRGRVRRRRATKGALAAAFAALIVAVPAAWWLQHSNGEEVLPPPTEETSTTVTDDATTPAEASAAPEGGPDAQDSEDAAPPVLPTFGDLVGAELELPLFFPEDGSLNDACPAGPATLGDGTPDWEGGQWHPSGGPVWVLKVVHTPLEEGGPTQAVALIGCRPGEAMVRQAVVVAADEDGGWEVTEQVALGDMSDFPLLDIAPAASAGVLLMVTDQETSGMYEPVPVGYRILRHRTGAELEDVTADAYLLGVTDIETSVEATELDDGSWRIELTMTNTGDHEALGLQLTACGSESFSLDQLDLPRCGYDTEGLGVYEGLAPGESAVEEWTTTPPPPEEWGADEDTGLFLMGQVRPIMYGAEVFSYDPDLSNNDFRVDITLEDVA